MAKSLCRLLMKVYGNHAIVVRFNVANISFKEKNLSKALTCMNFSCINKNAFLSRRRKPLATLLYEKFIHLT